MKLVQQIITTVETDLSHNMTGQSIGQLIDESIREHLDSGNTLTELKVVFEDEDWQEMAGPSPRRRK